MHKATQLKDSWITIESRLKSVFGDNLSTTVICYKKVDRKS